MGAICSSEVARRPHGRNWSRLGRWRQPRSGMDRRPEQKVRFFGLRFGSDAGLEMIWRNAPNDRASLGQALQPAVRLESLTYGARCSQILPRWCETQIPPSHSSYLDVESYRLCGLVGTRRSLRAPSVPGERLWLGSAMPSISGWSLDRLSFPWRSTRTR